MNQEQETLETKVEITRSQFDLYYRYFFPYDPFISWLLLHSVYPLSHREFSFSEDMWNRYKCFESATELKQALLFQCPNKLDVGPCYNVPVSQRKEVQTKFYAEEKELVFDIDITDYNKNNNHSRNCCSPTSMCDKCWPLMICAYEIMKFYFTEEFDFKEFIGIYSGRRGIHIHVSDESVKQYPDRSRETLLNYIIFNPKLLNTPTYDYIYNTFLIPCFEKMIQSQNRYYFNTEQDCYDICVKYFKNPEIVKKMLDGLFDDTTPIQRWKKINYFIHHGTNKQNEQLSLELKTLVFDRIYPKLDTDVSKSMIHLLKAPFSIHHLTGNICVPMNEFSLLKDLQKMNIFNLEYEFKQSNNNKSFTIQDSSLFKYIEHFLFFLEKKQK